MSEESFSGKAAIKYSPLAEAVGSASKLLKHLVFFDVKV